MDLDPSRDDIEGICRFFSIGKLQHFEKKRGINVLHSNTLIFAATSQGQFVLKFQAPDTAHTITAEYALNRILVQHHFPTPIMYAGVRSQPYLVSRGLLATCYSFINGVPAWQQIKERNTYHKINAALLSLKNILSADAGRISFPKQVTLDKTIHTLAQNSRLCAPYDQKKTIDAFLLKTCRTFLQHQPLFTRQRVHSDANVYNFLIHKKTIYTLDLAHIREDYILTDLACLVTSCLFLEIPFKTVKTIVKDYFTQHKTTPDPFVLNTLVKLGLIREYLKIIQRKRSLELSSYPQEFIDPYLSHLADRKRSLTAVLKKMNDTPGLIV